MGGPFYCDYKSRDIPMKESLIFGGLFYCDYKIYDIPMKASLIFGISTIAKM